MENSRNFYPKFFPLFWVVSGFTMPIAVVCGIFDIGFITWKLFLFYSIVLGFDIVGTYLIIKVPVTLTSEGFKCIDWMWTYKFVTWDNIRFVKPSRAFFGLPYLRIGLNDSKEVT